MSSLTGKLGIVFGVANKRSIAWAIARAWHQAGATLAFTYQGERIKENVEELAGTFGTDTLILPCDVSKDEDIAGVFRAAGEKFGKLHLLRHSVALMQAGSTHSELWVVQGADHGGAVNINRTDFERRILDWFHSHGKPVENHMKEAINPENGPFVHIF